jgi:Effector Associated Constant Component 1
VEIRISVADGDVADLESLDDWLRGERGLAGRVKLIGPVPHTGELGALTETLVVALGEGGAITVVGAALAGALRAWLSHPRRSDVTIKIHRTDGNFVEIVADRVKTGDIDIAAAIRQALDFGTTQELGSNALLVLDSGIAEE